MPAAGVVLTLTQDEAKRAGLTTAAVSTAADRRQLVVPGHIALDGYAETPVKSTSAARVTTVSVAQGATVTKGQVLARLYSPEAAEQQRVFLTMRTELEAAHAKLARAEQLVALGSMSQQDLEATRSEHTTHATEVESAKARLQLLGVNSERLDRLAAASEIDANVDVVAPTGGVVISRDINQGQNVETGDKLFMIGDVSRIWAVADVYERDVASVSVGDVMTVRSSDVGAREWRTTISYVDPRVAESTRTAEVRGDVANAGDILKAGMFVSISIETRTPIAGDVLRVPASAIQTIDGRDVVYVVDPTMDFRYLERVVQVGPRSGDSVQILSGLRPADRVAVTGTFFLRAERERLGFPPPGSVGR